MFFMVNGFKFNLIIKHRKERKEGDRRNEKEKEGRKEEGGREGVSRKKG